jgi:hypothetical protein
MPKTACKYKTGHRASASPISLATVAIAALNNSSVLQGPTPNLAPLTSNSKLFLQATDAVDSAIYRLTFRGFLDFPANCAIHPQYADVVQLGQSRTGHNNKGG